MSRECITLCASILDMAVDLHWYVVAFGPSKLGQIVVASKFFDHNIRILDHWILFSVSIF